MCTVSPHLQKQDAAQAAELGRMRSPMMVQQAAVGPSARHVARILGMNSTVQACGARSERVRMRVRMQVTPCR